MLAQLASNMANMAQQFVQVGVIAVGAFLVRDGHLGFGAIIALAGGRAAIEGWSTQRFKVDFLLRATSEGRTSIADMLRARADGAALVGDATVFVSHAYDYELLDVVDDVDRRRDQPVL